MFKKIIVIIAILCISSLMGFGENQAPAFSVRNDNGRVYTLDQFRGKTLMLFFFTFECPHCRRAMPYIEKLHKKNDMVILGIAFSTRYGELNSKIKKAGITFPVAVGTKRIADVYDIKGVPTIVVISPHGDIMMKRIGEKGIREIYRMLNRNKFR